MSDKALIAYHIYEDDQLIDLMRQGDSKALETLYLRYSRPLLTYALTITNNNADAADILQEIFVSLWNRRAEIQFTHSLKAWFYQAVRFQAVKFIRQCIRKNEFLQDLAAFSEVKDLCSPELQLEGVQLEYAIKSTINTMPTRMREVFVLSRMAQLSHREISQKLNIAESTVKKIVQNALRFIREHSVIDY